MTDAFLNGRITVNQAVDGYRFSIDAVLIAHLAAPREADRILDLGAGCGIIPILLTYRYPGVHVWAVEIQDTLVKMAEDNIRCNGMQDTVHVLHGDMKSLSRGQIGGAVDLVISNPPYRRGNSGRINPHKEKAIARHELKITLGELAQTARRFLELSGRFAAIYPAERMVDLTAALRDNGIEPKKIRMIHSRPATDARLIFVEGTRGGRPGVRVDAPLVIYQENGQYTDEVARMFAP